jgi:hypothetical protein
MLLRLVLLIALAPAIALAADTPAPSGKITVPPPPKVAAAPSPAPQPAALRTPTPPPAQDPADCRMSCAQTYYFCRAGERPDDCGGSWSQCAATCNSPNLDTSASATP